MPVPLTHLRYQGTGLAALAHTARNAFGSSEGKGPLTAPTPLITEALQPPPAALVRDYIRNAGGNPGAYRGVVPHHMFPQWAFHAMARTLDDVPYDLSKVLNGGCTVWQNGPLPADEPWTLTACLSAVDDDERRAIFTQRITTGPQGDPEALVAEARVILPKRRKGPKGPKAPPQTVPVDAREIGWWRLPGNAGLQFALLTGDFNPIHWIPPAAKAAGFKRCILHGYATLARAFEGVVAARLGGDPTRIASIDVRFSKPVLLPGEVGLYLGDDHELFVGTAPGAPAALLGTYVEKDGHHG